ncbi:MAG: LAGLIDADG family homing endonuclease [Thermoproteales archaeon]|nr:LAGLIDADG family homing endonuclease [Thermoproteales archaeon]
MHISKQRREGSWKTETMKYDKEVLDRVLNPKAWRCYVLNIKGYQLIQVRIAAPRSMEKALAIADAVAKIYGFEPKLKSCWSGYRVFLSRWKDVKLAVKLGAQLGEKEKELYYRRIEAESNPRERKRKISRTGRFVDFDNTSVWYVLGALMSDGTINGRNRFSLKLEVMDRVFAKKFAKKVQEVGFASFGGPNGRGKIEVRFVSKQIAMKLMELREKPELLKKLSSRCFWAFIEGFYEGDGCVYVKFNKRGAFQIFVKFAQKPKPTKVRFLQVLRDVFQLYGIRSSLYVYEKLAELLILDRRSIYLFFKYVNPCIKNLAAQKLSYKHKVSLRKRGIPIENARKEWQKAWKLLEKNFSDYKLDIAIENK